MAKFFVAGSRRPVAEFRPPIAWLFLAWRYSHTMVKKLSVAIEQAQTELQSSYDRVAEILWSSVDHGRRRKILFGNRCSMKGVGSCFGAARLLLASLAAAQTQSSREESAASYLARGVEW